MFEDRVVGRPQVLALLGCILCLAWPATAARGDEQSPLSRPARKFEVQRVRDIAYRELYKREDPARNKNKLDLYLPRGQRDFPVVFFVHGGAWRSGDKDYLGIYSTFALSLARQGIGAVVINYRLSPQVQHPEHIKDVAQAFAWTYRNISKYGGRPDEIFLCGHSAGGHLVALLATDESYLKAEGLTLRAIRGAVPMSGVYRIPDTSELFSSMFGDDVKVRKAASPIAHASLEAPPFLIVYAEKDLPWCGKDCSEDFCKALRDKKCTAQTLEIKERTHVTLILNACVMTDPVARALLEFMAAQMKKSTAKK